MFARGALILLLFGLLGDTSAERGREGNARFEDEQYSEAAAAYREGLAALDDTTGSLYTALQNNLGLALHRQGDYGAARTAFDRARRTAATKDERVRAHFNTAIAAAAMGDRAEALRHFRRVLLLDPNHEAARFNYEYVRRQEGTRSARPAPRVDPSAYARRIKKQAEALVADQQYTTAAALMRDALQRDSTVSAYRNFMRRLDEVAQINRSQP